MKVSPQTILEMEGVLNQLLFANFESNISFRLFKIQQHIEGQSALLRKTLRSIVEKHKGIEQPNRTISYPSSEAENKATEEWNAFCEQEECDISSIVQEVRFTIEEFNNSKLPVVFFKYFNIFFDGCS